LAVIRPAAPVASGPDVPGDGMGGRDGPSLPRPRRDDGHRRPHAPLRRRPAPAPSRAADHRVRGAARARRRERAADGGPPRPARAAGPVAGRRDRSTVGGMLRAAVLRLPCFAALVASAFLGAFLLTALAPGDAAYQARGLGADAYDAERARLGVDRPVAERLRVRLARALVLDLGTSTRFGVPVLPLVAERAGRTLLAGALALAAAMAIGMPAGLATAQIG